MILREEQVRVLERHRLQDFVSNMEKHLRSSFPGQTRDSDSARLKGGIATAIQVAKGFGLIRECDVEGYLNVMCASVGNIGGDPPDWVHHILADGDLSADSKIELLYSGYQDRRRGQLGR